MLTIGSLFSGIGGLELGLEWAGLGPVKWQVEIDPYCRKVLAKHWPAVTRYEDIRDVGKHNLEPVDLICGGFPCQDVSVAGSRKGINTGTRSGLWFELLRIIGEIRPKYAVVENVTGLFTAGFERVVSDVSEIGYDAEWDVVPAGACGLPHIRERVLLVAYPSSKRWSFPDGKAPSLFAGQCVPDKIKSGYRWRSKDGGHRVESVGWTVEPTICGSDDGVSVELAKCELKALGNAVVPQVAQVIGEMIKFFEAEHGR